LFGVREVEMTLSCSVCGSPFDAVRASARYCGAACRQRAKYNRDAGKPMPKVVALMSRRVDSAMVDAAIGEDADGSPANVVSAVTRELGPLVNSALGQQALVLARRLDAKDDVSGSAVASVSKQLTMLLAVAEERKADANPADPVAAVQAQVMELRARHASGQ